MTRMEIHLWLVVLATIPALSSPAQSQSCPVNINFSSGTLTYWQAYTGNNRDGNGPSAIKLVYDSSQPAPTGTIGAVVLPEFNLAGVSGIQVITRQGTDAFGSFQMIPTINGYAYHYSILLGSTSVTNHQTMDESNPGSPPNSQPANGMQGGYVRGISYLINVPTGPSTTPYTMTYAYAMVLENGTHASEDQPMARAIVSTPAGVIGCASPAYFLPTDGGQLDSATARANGFSPSPVPTPNASPNSQNTGQHLQDVWTKGWTEVTFDLSPYRGQQITLTFEADNCVPGGHFAYAYFALRDVCAGLGISGDTLACTNSIVKYSIPSLDSASYDWSAPAGWVIDSGGNGNAITVTVGPQPGWIVARERNSCTSLTDSLFVLLYKGALPREVIDPPDTTICFGGTASLRALVTTGTEYAWVTAATSAEGSKGSISSLPFAIDSTVAPEQSTDYVLNIRNDGCPITVSATFTVNVVPPIRVNLPKDTLVVLDEPLHFRATSSDPYNDDYQWAPATDLSNPNIADPIGLYGSDIGSITYQVTATDSFGCHGADTVHVTVAHTLPDIFVPNAFTPGMNTNNVFRPVCMGISSLEYFGVYNRWGQLLYETSQIGQGWDGRIQGKLQESNVYLWVLKGTDYTGRVITKKGTVVLIR
ncbi:MAG TPA: gliding motility-associated C-terminal domain-containing protein [Puia sp.]|jgi:gliding motility-associated-like protein|nr:gliding motility-associated C-terminal domain-containing protein [Puia sp.]